MAAVPSTMQPLGSPLHRFELPNFSSTNSEVVNSESALRHPVLLMFICNHCPYVVHIVEEMVSLASTYLVSNILCEKRKQVVETISARRGK